MAKKDEFLLVTRPEQIADTALQAIADPTKRADLKQLLGESVKDDMQAAIGVLRKHIQQNTPYKAAVEADTAAIDLISAELKAAANGKVAAQPQENNLDMGTYKPARKR